MEDRWTWCTVAAIADRLNRPESTIRSWRDRYRPFVPERRDEDGHKTYPLERLAEIEVLQGEHLTPREIRRVLMARDTTTTAPAPADRLDQILAELRELRAVVDATHRMVSRLADEQEQQEKEEDT